MTKRPTHFNNAWMDKSQCSTWLSPGNLSTEAKRTKCDSVFSISSGGFNQVMQHAGSKQHIRLAEGEKGQAQLHVAGSGTVSLQPGSGRHIGHDDQVTRAEIVLLFRLVKHDYAFASYDVMTLRTH